MGRLTTHILDTANGTPAANVSVRVYSMDQGRDLCATAVTNDDGRTEAPLLEGDAFRSGGYEIEFDIGAYFANAGHTLSEPAFLDTVVIRFGVRSDQHYHVPLLASPWSYSTYRGS